MDKISTETAKITPRRYWLPSRCGVLDQSHNVTDPIESLMNSAVEVQRAYVQSSLMDCAALAAFQQANDASSASQSLNGALRTDVSPILAMARVRAGGAANPVAAYRERVSAARPARAGASSNGFV